MRRAASDEPALERWLIAAGIVNSAGEKRLVKSWRNAPEAALFLKDLIAFRERLREAVLHLEGGLAPSDEFTQEVNQGLFEHRPATVLRKLEGRVIIREQLLDLKRPTDLWALFFDGAADRPC